MTSHRSRPRTPEHAAREGRRLWCLALGALVLAGVAQAQFLVPEGSRYHNGSTLPLADDGEAEAVLTRLGDALAVGDVDGAAHQMRVLRGEVGRAMVPLGPRTHVPALDAGLRRVLASSHAPTRERVEAELRQEVRRAREERDVAALTAWARRVRASPVADEAALWAARFLFEEGRWWEAGALVADVRGPTAEALREVLAAEGPAEPAAGDGPRGPWQLRFAFNYRIDVEEEAGLPLMVDGRPGETLLMDAGGLVGLDLSAQGPRLTRTFEEFDWAGAALEDERFRVGLPAPRRQVLVRQGDRLIIPFNVTGNPRWRSPREPREARLLAVDLATPPRLAWSVAVPGVISSAVGTPLIAGDRIFALVDHVDLETRVDLHAFDLATGEQLFVTPLVRGSVVARFDARNMELHVNDLDKRGDTGALAEHRGVIHASTGYGLVAAVDGASGELLHTFRYDRLFSVAQNVYDPAYLFDTGGWVGEPVRVFGERIVVAPPDSRYLYMIATEPSPGGFLIREDPIERLDRRGVLSLVPDPEGGEAPWVAALRQRDDRLALVVLDDDGHVRIQGPGLPRGEGATGDPVVAGGLALVPTRAGVRVWEIDRPQAPPVLLPRPEAYPVPRAVRVLEGGLAVLCPKEDDALHVLFWEEVGAGR